MKTQFQESIKVSSNGHRNPTSPTPHLGGDNPLWFEGALFNFLVAGEDTQGQVALLEAVQRKGDEPPFHIHQETDETFYVIEGKMTFYVAGETIVAPAGTNVFIERGKEHTFTVETETANTLILFTPAVSRGFFKALSALALKQSARPNGSAGMAKYDLKITAPHPLRGNHS